MAAVSMTADQETENGGTWEVRLYLSEAHPSDLLLPVKATS